MSTLDYLDEKTGSVRYNHVPWRVLNGWLSSLNSNKQATNEIPPEGTSRGKVIDELQRRHKLKPNSLHASAFRIIGNDLGYSKDWREHENEKGYTHLEELLIYQPTEWRKQAREYLLKYSWSITRKSTDISKRTVLVTLYDDNGDEHLIPIKMSSPVKVVLFHIEMTRTSRYAPLLFLLSWGAVSPLREVKREIQCYVTGSLEESDERDNIALELHDAMVSELSPLDYFFLFQEYVDMYGVKQLRKAAMKCKFPRLLLMRELDFANIVGQRLAKNMIRQAVVRYIMAREETGPFASKPRPLSLIFAGPSGNGKTEMAEWLATLINKPQDNLFLKVDCAQLNHAGELFGMAGPYQGAEEGSHLNNFVQKLADTEGAVGVVLLDEFEKARVDVVHGLYQVLDKGEWTDKRLEAGSGSQTKPISCKDIIFIMTTNAADNMIVDGQEKMSFVHGERG